MILYLDFETYSEADIRKVGAYRYAEDPSTEALMLAYALGDSPVRIWDISNGETMPEGDAIVSENLLRALLNEDVTISAANATFERLILKHCLGIDLPVERFDCTLVRAYGLSFTGGLDDVLSQFIPDYSKDKRGKDLINRFSKPQAKNRKVRRWTRDNDPEGWQEFMSYCKQDVVVERQLRKALEPYEQLQSERDLYHLDQRINDNGVPIDKDLVNTALTIATIERDKLIDRMTYITGLDNPNSNEQLRKWIETKGLVLPNMQKETLERELSRDQSLPKNIEDVIEMKLQVSKASVKKWNAYDRCLCKDNRVHGMFQFGGASRTNRWAGRIVQLQNLARGGNTTKRPDTLAEVMLSGGHDAVQLLYGDPMMALSDTVRAAITAPDGLLLNVSDLGSIESRVVGWISDCALINDTFAEGRDTYMTFATKLYGIPYSKVTKEQRTFCKPAVLGAPYGLGKKSMVDYAAGMGIKLTEEEADIQIKSFRASHPEICSFENGLWGWVKEAVFHTTLTGGECQGKHGLKTFAHGEFLMLQLPSGRNIAYHLPKIEERPAPWDKEQMIDCFTFMGKDRFTMKWSRIAASHGHVVENIVQAVARDVLAVWMERAHKAGFNLVGHVHDELIALENTDRVEELNDLIRQPISWAPGLLLDADGYAARRYKKD